MIFPLWRFDIFLNFNETDDEWISCEIGTMEWFTFTKNWNEKNSSWRIKDFHKTQILKFDDTPHHCGIDLLELKELKLINWIKKKKESRIFLLHYFYKCSPVKANAAILTVSAHNVVRTLDLHWYEPFDIWISFIEIRNYFIHFCAAFFSSFFCYILIASNTRSTHSFFVSNLLLSAFSFK